MTNFDFSQYDSELSRLGANKILVIREDGTKLYSKNFSENIQQISALSASLMHALQSLNTKMSHRTPEAIETSEFLIVPMNNYKIFVLITYQKEVLISQSKFKIKKFLEKINFTESHESESQNLLFANLTENELEEVFKRIRIN